MTIIDTLDTYILVLFIIFVLFILAVIEHSCRLEREIRETKQANRRMAVDLAVVVKQMETNNDMQRADIAKLHEMAYHDFIRKPLRPDSIFPIYISQVKGEG